MKFQTLRYDIATDAGGKAASRFMTIAVTDEINYPGVIQRSEHTFTDDEMLLMEEDPNNLREISETIAAEAYKKMVKEDVGKPKPPVTASKSQLDAVTANIREAEVLTKAQAPDPIKPPTEVITNGN